MEPNKEEMLLRWSSTLYLRGHCGRDRMIVGLTTTDAINACHHYSFEFEPHSWRGTRYNIM